MAFTVIILLEQIWETIVTYVGYQNVDKWKIWLESVSRSAGTSTCEISTGEWSGWIYNSSLQWQNELPAKTAWEGSICFRHWFCTTSYSSILYLFMANLYLMMPFFQFPYILTRRHALWHIVRHYMLRSSIPIERIEGTLALSTYCHENFQPQ